jgi:ribosomal protein S12 methylthiotransferase
VPEVIARERADQLSSVADDAMERRATSVVGSVFEVLAERLDPQAGLWFGRSQREAPEIDGDIRFAAPSSLRVGDYAPVEITGNDGADLIGEVVR